MAVAAVERPHVQEQPPLHTGMMGMVIFLASEVMFFGALFAVYFYLFGSHIQWPPAGTNPVHYWPLPVINTFILLSSGVTAHFALESLGGERSRWQRVIGAPLMVFSAVMLVYFATRVLGAETRFELLLASVGAVLTIVSALVLYGAGPLRGATRGAFFLLWILTILLGAGFEAGQAFEFYSAHIRFTTNQFASVFFTMTGFHGLHVAGGLVLLLLILGRASRGQFSPRHHVGPAAVTLYWHFVDIVWLFLFGVLYLAVTYGTPG